MKVFEMIEEVFFKWSRSFKIMQNVIFQVKLQSLTSDDFSFSYRIVCYIRRLQLIPCFCLLSSFTKGGNLSVYIDFH